MATPGADRRFHQQELPRLHRTARADHRKAMPAWADRQKAMPEPADLRNETPVSAELRTAMIESAELRTETPESAELRTETPESAALRTETPESAALRTERAEHRTGTAVSRMATVANRMPEAAFQPVLRRETHWVKRFPRTYCH